MLRCVCCAGEGRMDGRMDNFTYLMTLNLMAGRLPRDPNNHPVMPWVRVTTWRHPSPSRKHTPRHTTHNTQYTRHSDTCA